MTTAEPTAVTDAATWKASAQGVDLEVPSGKTCKVRRKPMDSFLRRGLIPNSLLPLVRKAIKGEDMDDTKMEDLTEDQIIQTLELYDIIVVDCVVAPKVYPVPKFRQEDVDAGRCTPEQVGTEVPLDDRNQDFLYVDEVDQDDKIFIYQFVVGGTRDLESFRAEQSAAMERLRGGADVAAAP